MEIMILSNYESIIAPLKKIQIKLQKHIASHTERIENLSYKKESLDNAIDTSFNEISKSKTTENKIFKLLN